MKYAVLAAALAFGLAAAAPSSRPGRLNGARSRPNQRNDTFATYSGNWAGAVQVGKGFHTVQGTITVPEVSGDSGSAVSAWVGIDGDTCQTAILQTGVSFYADGSFDAWYEWIPDQSFSFANFDLGVGDQIRMTVDASSKTVGVAMLENLSTGRSVKHRFTRPPSTLCETNAEWIVEDFEQGDDLVPFADFGTITFTDASAIGSSGTVTPQGATVFDIRNKDTEEIFTDCAIEGNDVTCAYVNNEMK